MEDPWEVSVRKIVAKIIAKKDSDIFRAPVPYEELGLNDYIEIVKEPMDLGTVLKKLDGKEYACQDDCAKDVRRIWVNALLYNMPGSKIYTTAKALSESFELNYLPLARDDVNRPPNAEEMTSWVAGIDTCNLLPLLLLLPLYALTQCYLLFCFVFHNFQLPLLYISRMITILPLVLLCSILHCVPRLTVPYTHTSSFYPYTHEHNPTTCSVLSSRTFNCPYSISLA